MYNRQSALRPAWNSPRLRRRKLRPDNVDLMASVKFARSWRHSPRTFIACGTSSGPFRRETSSSESSSECRAYHWKRETTAQALKEHRVCSSALKRDCEQCGCVRSRQGGRPQGDRACTARIHRSSDWRNHPSRKHATRRDSTRLTTHSMSASFEYNVLRRTQPCCS